MAKTTKAAEGQLDLGGSQAPNGLKIISLQAENLKRLTAVRIYPRGNLVEIRGRNAQGKQQPISEPVLTPKVWVPIGDIKIGDRVIGSSGFPIEVMGVFPQEERFRRQGVGLWRPICGPWDGT